LSVRTAWDRIRSFRPTGEPLAAAKAPPKPEPDVQSVRAETISPVPAGAFVVEPHRPRFARGVRLVAIGIIALFALSGFGGQVARLLGAGGDRVVAGPPPAVDHSSTRQLAVAFTGDYWSYDAANPAVRETAISRWTGRTSDFDPTWDGVGQLRADLVTAGQVADLGEGRVLVATTARVTPASLPEGAGLPEARPSATEPAAADPGPAVAPWIAGTPRWLSLDVVIDRAEGKLQVIAATLTGDAVTPITSPTTQVDAAATSATSDFATDVFTAYASGGSNLGYITTPDVQLAGLGGLATVTDVTGWELSPADGDGVRYATARVTWQLTGTTLTITQPYALRVTQTDGRWLVAAISTDQED